MLSSNKKNTKTLKNHVLGLGGPCLKKYLKTALIAFNVNAKNIFRNLMPKRTWERNLRRR